MIVEIPTTLGQINTLELIVPVSKGIFLVIQMEPVRNINVLKIK